MKLSPANLKRLREAAKQLSNEATRLYADFPRSLRVAHVRRLVNELAEKVSISVEGRKSEALKKEICSVLVAILEDEGDFEYGELAGRDREGSPAFETLATAGDSRYHLDESVRQDENFEFEVNGEVVPGAPTEEMIDVGLRSLRGGFPSFAILSRSAMTYMQASGCAESGFDLEYQDGSLKEHYRCVDDPLGIATVMRAMHLYLVGDDGWRIEIAWERYPL